MCIPYAQNRVHIQVLHQMCSGSLAVAAEDGKCQMDLLNEVKEQEGIGPVRADASFL